MSPRKSQWSQRRERDQFYGMAKKFGYRSRSAYKLLEIARTHQLIHLDDKVVDLGACPGGWMQVARELVGGRGYVLGVDVKLIEATHWKNVETIEEDITSDSVVDRILTKTEGPVHVVLSDVSPNISGIWETDHARQMYLAEKSLEIALRILRKDGSFLVKLFHGPSLRGFVERVRSYFQETRLLKPKASRAESSEVYLIAKSLMVGCNRKP